jgi:hypothetical protein
MILYYVVKHQQFFAQSHFLYILLTDVFSFALIVPYFSSFRPILSSKAFQLQYFVTELNSYIQGCVHNNITQEGVSLIR